MMLLQSKGQPFLCHIANAASAAIRKSSKLIQLLYLALHIQKGKSRGLTPEITKLGHLPDSTEDQGTGVLTQARCHCRAL